jgi:hypothetical protein
LIGAKTIATLTVLVTGLVLAFSTGSLAPSVLLAQGPGALFAIGLFASMVGTLMYRFWRLGEKSHHCFRWSFDDTLWEAEGHFLGTERWRIAIGENDGFAFDLSPRAQHGVSVTIALILALVCLDARTLGLFDRFQHSLFDHSSSYCKEEEPEEPDSGPRQAGCELVRRAFALGYATTLGDCEPKKKKAEVKAPCTLRQRDEPFSHYAWRLFDRFTTRLLLQTDASYVDKQSHDFSARIDHLASLQKSERQVLVSAPRAAHHIWTNLPDPGDGAFLEETCIDRYRWLPHRSPRVSGKERASKVFEHVVAQLLFESRYEPAAGYCREYHVHWDAPLDACDRLASQGETFLEGSDALESVEAALDRFHLERDLEPLSSRRSSLEPPSFISFSCYFESDRPQRRTAEVSVLGQRFEAEIVGIPQAPESATVDTDRYDAISKLLVHGFHYGALLSEAAVEQHGSEGIRAALGGKDFLLSRLYELESFDIYLDPGWIVDRPDLLEVYPYQRHLKNYVQMFRRQYRLERGRL